ncbi:hypothetical protein GCM10010990_02980 [Croceicoccus mobilis]|uniref:Uncharacterized protein n=1 Tax=Croceicoccus mobilis TaxID=1703339 RepID=A0A916YRG5_9SPHN|nr:hypothetical protein GCM10010990_02980 [Croceicoccus mobilis]
MNNRVIRFCDWLQSVPPEPHFSQRPEYEFFADLSDEELLAAEQELVRRIAVVGTEHHMNPAFLDFIQHLPGRAHNAP